MYWRLESVSGIFLLPLLLLASPWQGIKSSIAELFSCSKPVNLVGKQSRQYVLKWLYICFKKRSCLDWAFGCSAWNTVMELVSSWTQNVYVKKHFKMNGELVFDMIVLKLSQKHSTLIQHLLFFSLVKVMVHRKKWSMNHFLFRMVSTGK